MKTIINAPVFDEDLPALVEFHYSEEEGQVVNVHKIELISDNYKPADITVVYHINDDIRQKINEELTDKYRRGEYED
ncbi:MAG: hypothetical protein COB12_12005 [Flavobacterium sp.]|nr:MAG: hypothetical protein COB12_12005 [Flavobacterium sp.]